MLIHIIDFGSKKIRNISEMLKSLGHETVVQVWDKIDQESLKAAKGIILSGSPTYLSEVDHSPYFEHCKFLTESTVPVLGICFGHQVLGLLHGAEVFRGPAVRETIPIALLSTDPLFVGLGKETLMTEDHTEGITIPKGFIHLATSDTYKNEGMKHKQKNIWGIQFHPEVSGTNGKNLLRNFCTLCA